MLPVSQPLEDHIGIVLAEGAVRYLRGELRAGMPGADAAKGGAERSWHVGTPPAIPLFLGQPSRRDHAVEASQLDGELGLW